MTFLQLLHFLPHPWLLFFFVLVSLVFIFISFGLTIEWYRFSIDKMRAFNFIAVYFLVSIAIIGSSAFLIISILHA